MLLHVVPYRHKKEVDLFLYTLVGMPEAVKYSARRILSSLCFQCMQEFVATGKYGIANMVITSKPSEKSTQTAPVDQLDMPIGSSRISVRGVSHGV